MFQDSTAFSSFAVDDLAAAKRFYGQTLGFPVTEHMDGAIIDVTLPGGDHHVMVYPKDDFVPATYTVLNFPVRDVDAAVDELTKQGIEMARFEGFDQDARGIAHDGGGPAIAWFRDPEGNILSVVEDVPA
jgi:catechol 2,3-dioxygenase-like lactoylglutathione lyase family enzyme